MERRVEEVLVDASAEAIPPDDALPADVAAALAPLDSLSDADLWEVARTRRLSPAAAAHLEELNHKPQREGLDAEEDGMVASLLHHYERAMLVRAEALAQLKERGKDISALPRPADA